MNRLFKNPFRRRSSVVSELRTVDNAPTQISTWDGSLFNPLHDSTEPFLQSDFCVNSVCHASKGGLTFDISIYPRWNAVIYDRCDALYMANGGFNIYTSMREMTYRLGIYENGFTDVYQLVLTSEDVDSYGPTVIMKHDALSKVQAIEISRQVQLNLENYAMEMIL